LKGRIRGRQPGHTIAQPRFGVKRRGKEKRKGTTG